MPSPLGSKVTQSLNQISQSVFGPAGEGAEQGAPRVDGGERDLLPTVKGGKDFAWGSRPRHPKWSAKMRRMRAREPGFASLMSSNTSPPGLVFRCQTAEIKGGRRDFFEALSAQRGTPQALVRRLTSTASSHVPSFTAYIYFMPYSPSSSSHASSLHARSQSLLVAKKKQKQKQKRNPLVCCHVPHSLSHCPSVLHL